MSFKQFHTDRMKDYDLPGIAFTFGRNQPPHSGHVENFEVLGVYAKKHKMDAVIYSSWSQNAKKNPLSPGDKIYFLRKVAPKGVKVSDDQSLKNSFSILEDLIKNKGYKRIAFLVGSDRVSDFNTMKKYAQEWSSGTATLEVISSGNRKKGISGTDVRNFVKENNFEAFEKILPSRGLTHQDKLDLFDKVKAGMGV